MLIELIQADDYEVDPELENGPLFKRGCTDVLCLLVFLAFCVGIGFIFLQGWNYGDPKKLLAPLDSDGNFCGVDPGLVDYKYLYFDDISVTNWLPFAVCVESCPET